MGVTMTKDRLSGIADEGAATIDEQLDLHTAFGWRRIELRTVHGVNVCEMSDEAFAPVRDAIMERGFEVSAFGSAIANWSRPVNGPFSKDREDLLRAAPRMRELHTPFIRIMSYTSGGLDEQEWSKEALKRVRELTRIAKGEGVVLVHENCDGWASGSPKNLSRLLDEIPDPELQIVFDPGNPLAHGHNPEAVMDFYGSAKERIVHFHIKDCYRGSDGEVVHCYPGQGQCHVSEIVADLERSGYRGEYSIEPHMAVEIHKGMDGDTEVMAAIYRRYAEETERLLEPLLT